MKVLLLGDSHTYGPYGSSLAALFEANGASVDRVAVVGASARHFLNGTWTKLKGKTRLTFPEVRGKSYDLIIVSLGTNDAAGISTREGAERVASNMKSLTDSLTGRRIFWVGGPAVNPVAAVTYNKAFAKYGLDKRVQLVWDAVSPGYGAMAIDPRPVTKSYAASLGGEIHFGPKGGKAWAEYVYGITSRGEQGVVEAPVETAGGEGAAVVGETAQSPVGSLLAIALITTAAIVLLRRTPPRGIFAPRARFAG